MTKLTTDDLSRFWLGFGAAFALCRRKGYTGDHLLWSTPPIEMNTNVLTSLMSLRLGGVSSQIGIYLEAHQGFKLLPEWCYRIIS